MTPPPSVLEFTLDPTAAARLPRHPLVAASRAGRARNIPLTITWHDSPEGALAARALSICEQGGLWRLERLVPGAREPWLPATPAPVLAEALAPELLAERLPAALGPVASFNGRLRTYALTLAEGPVRLDVLDGALRGPSHHQPACRVRLAGAPQAIATLALALGAPLPLRVPQAGLAAAALAVAQGTASAPRRLGGPAVPPQLALSESLALVLGHLADVILHWAPRTLAGAGPEPVHQMRVAVRRLRSAISVFRRAAQPGAFTPLGQALKHLAGLLGAARDWDVFLEGTGAAVAAAFPAEPSVAALLAAAARKRAAAYAALAAYMAGDDWQHLTLSLAVLPTAQPWLVAVDEAQAAVLAAPAAGFAATALRRCHKRVLAAGAEFGTLDPIGLHALRKQGKQLRYASEFFAPLFGGRAMRRFVDKLVELQAALGAVNDGTVAAEKMAELAGGPGRAFAVGVVRGYVAGINAPASADAARAWRKFTHVSPFWD